MRLCQRFVKAVAFACLIIAGVAFNARAQVSGTVTVPGTYASIALAITDLNNNGVGAGGVTINIAAGYTETITSQLSLTATGTAANPIIFQKSGSGANPLITAYTGTTTAATTTAQDGIWRFIGSDYVTIDGIDLTDPVGNNTTTTAMEYGYAFYKASTTNGAQNNTVKNCTITLNTLNNATSTGNGTPGSTGIIIFNGLFSAPTGNFTPSSAAGSNSNNDIYNNTITAFTGISIVGYNATAALIANADLGNDIGGTSLSTGNTITYGYTAAVAATTVSAGITVSGQQGVNIGYNTVTSAVYPGLLRGIYMGAAVSASATVTNNTIQVNGGNGTTTVDGIETAAGSTPNSNTISITNNTISGGSYAYGITANGFFYGIYNNAGTPATLTISGNTVTGNTITNTNTTTTVVSFYGLYNAGTCGTLNITGNTVANNTINNSSTSIANKSYSIYNQSGVTAAININNNNIGTATLSALNITGTPANTGANVLVNNSGGTATTALSISNNNFYNVNYTTTTVTSGSLQCINSGTTNQTVAINNNVFNNLNPNTTGALTLINSGAAVPTGGTLDINSNSISGTLSKTATGAITCLSITGTSTGGTINHNNNTFSNITSNGSSTITGITLTDATVGSTSRTIQGNTFANWSNANTPTGGFTGITTTTSGNASTATLIIQNNSFTGWATSGTAASTYVSTAVGGTTNNASVTVQGNTISGLNNSGTGAITGITLPISSTGTPVVNCLNNNLTNWTITANSTINGIISTINGTSNTANLTIQGNTITTINNGGTGTVTGIAPTISGTTNATVLTVQNNSITGVTNNVNAAISGINLQSTQTAATGTSNIAANTLTGFTNNGTGATTGITAVVSTTSATAATNVQNNNLNNWTAGTSTVSAGAIIGISANITPNGNNVTGNLINTISSTGAAAGTGSVTGITTSAGNSNIWGNTINNLSTSANNGPVNGISATAGTTGTIQEIFKNTIFTLSAAGTGAVTGVLISGGTTDTVNVYKNKIYDMSNSNTGTAGPYAYGISVTGGTGVSNIYDNIVGNITAPASGSTDAIRGISINNATANSAYKVYYNTIYITGTSTGTNFGNTGLYANNSTTASTTVAVLDLRNNIIVNTSTLKGTGKIVAYRRSGVIGASGSTNYATTSNNNIYYAGTASANNVLYYDGTNGYQTIATFRAGTNISPRETASQAEDETANFISTTGSSPSYLRINTSATTLAKNGGAVIASITTDIDGEIRQGSTGYIGTGTAPTIGADEIIVDVTKPAITYTNIAAQTVSTSISLSSVTITDANGVNTIPGSKPRLYYKRSIDGTSYVDNTSATNGWKYVEATGTTSPFTFNIDYTLLYGGGTNASGNIQYFVVAQDIASTPNIQINSGTFNSAPSSVALTSAAFPIGGTVNSYNVNFSGTYKVGTGTAYPSFSNTANLFDQINTYGLSGNVVINVASDMASESGTVALNAWTETPAASNYTLTIQPDATTTRTISGTVAGPMIRFNGADRVTITGGTTTNKNLVFTNNYTATAISSPAITLTNGAQGNTFSNIEVDAYSTTGAIFFGTGTGTSGGGNNTNTIDNCNINASIGSFVSAAGISSVGTATAGQENTSNTVSNTNIYNYLTTGLSLGTGNTTWSLIKNSLYNAAVTGGSMTAGAYYGIRVTTGAGYTITGNSVGGSAAGATGANAIMGSSGALSFTGISLTTSSATASVIKGNTVSGITMSVVPTTGFAIFKGIETSGSGITVGGSSIADGNTIGSTSTNAAISITTNTASALATLPLIYGIYHAATGGTVNYNQVGGFDISNVGTTPTGTNAQFIATAATSPATQVNNNLIGSQTLANSIRVLAASTATTTTLSGIAVNGATSTTQINNNRIDHLSNLSTTASGIITGINNLATVSGAVVTIQTDTVQNISGAANTNAAASLHTGISATSPSTISNNVITAFTHASTGTGAQIVGINTSGAFAYTISNNTISNLTSSSTKANTAVETTALSSSAVAGIVNTATAAGQSVTGNTLFTLGSTPGTATVSTSVVGIGVSGGTATTTGNISANRIYGFTTTSTSTTAGLTAILALTTTAGNTFNIYNNVIKLSNGSSTNSVKIYGISVGGTAATVNTYYNSVQISGSTAGSVKSAGFIRASTNVVTLQNNVFINTRTTTATKINYAISNPAATPATGWAATASDYNDLYSSTSTAVGEWGSGVSKSFTGWQAAQTAGSGGDSHSTSQAVTFIASTADLLPDGTTNCFIYHTGIPVSGITTDILAATRDASTPSMGAYEFTYTATTVTWTGTISTDWNNSRNWCGFVPTSTTDVIIGTGATFYPVLTTGTYTARNFTIQASSTVTVNGGTLQIAGTISNSGTFTATNTAGTIELNGSTAQTIPAAFFATNTVGNLRVNNASGVTLGSSSTLNITGVLYPVLGTFSTNSGAVTLVSNASGTASVDGTGSGLVSGDVTVQRYLAVGYGYKYFSSPVQPTTIASFASIRAASPTFPDFYQYTENVAGNGFTRMDQLPTTTVLTPFVGYVINTGSATAAKTASVTGALNDGPFSQGLSNNNQTYTQGFNLVGNPYPSTIDWDASSGWTKTNIDDAIYYFDSAASSGGDQYAGAYSSYVAGVSSDGIANNLIASMQGFFVHVSDGTYPVSGTLGVTDAVRVNNGAAFFHKSNSIRTNSITRSLVRVSAAYSTDSKSADPVVVYTDGGATPTFNRSLDAVKLLNTNENVLNLYVQRPNKLKLAINALQTIDTSTVVPLSIKVPKDGNVDFSLMAAENLPGGVNPYLYDARIGKHIALNSTSRYTVKLAAGTYDGRFFITYNETDDNIGPDVDNFYVYRKDGKVYANIRFTDNQPGDLSLVGITGNVISKQRINGNGIYDLGSPRVLGIYVISFMSNGRMHAKKIFVPE